MTNIEKEVLYMKNQFLAQNDGKNPTKVYIPSNKENEFFLIDGYPINEDVRNHFKNIQGLNIVWNAQEFKVE